MGTNILRINPAYQVKRTVMFNGTSPIGKPVQLIRESSERGIFYEIMVDGKLNAGFDWNSGKFIINPEKPLSIYDNR